MNLSKEQSQNWLGCNSIGTARYRLFRKVLFNLIQRNKEDICFKCNQSIKSELDLTLAHITPWRKCYSREGSKELFWDFNNLSWEHKWCNTIDDKTYKYESIVDININSNSTELYKQLDKEILGKIYQTCNKQLYNNVLYDLCCKLNLNKCYRCGNIVQNSKELSLDHIIPWYAAKDEDKQKLYYAIDNIAFSHLSCNSSAGRKNKRHSKYLGVTFKRDKNHKNAKKVWIVELRTKNKKLYIGGFETQEEAAFQRDLAVFKHNNGNGILNFPDKIEEYKKLTKITKVPL